MGHTQDRGRLLFRCRFYKLDLRFARLIILAWASGLLNHLPHFGITALFFELEHGNLRRQSEPLLDHLFIGAVAKDQEALFRDESDWVRHLVDHL